MATPNVTQPTLLKGTGLYTLPELPYAYDALEPWIDTETMRVHHDGHHRAYVTKLNDALRGSSHQGQELEELLRIASSLPSSVRNNAGGHWNHSFFWKILTPDRNRNIAPSALETLISRHFGSMQDFRNEFKSAGQGVIGSGWVWLVRTEGGSLSITTTPNQDNPLMDTVELRGWPILTCDVWEHAYYLKHQNHRDEYLNDFWKVVDWHSVEENFRSGVTHH